MGGWLVGHSRIPATPKPEYVIGHKWPVFDAVRCMMGRRFQPKVSRCLAGLSAHNSIGNN